MRIKRRREGSTTFGLSLDTRNIDTYSKDKDGNLIDPSFNNKTFINKAFKAYLKGKNMFTYKGKSYIVPRVNKNYIKDEEE